MHRTQRRDPCVARERDRQGRCRGALKGLGLRVFNRETREWEHTGTDTLAPGHLHVWKGAFTGGKIDLFARRRPDGARVT